MSRMGEEEGAYGRHGFELCVGPECGVAYDHLCQPHWRIGVGEQRFDDVRLYDHIEYRCTEDGSGGGGAYDESPRVAFAGDVERTGREAWEHFD